MPFVNSNGSEIFFQVAGPEQGEALVFAHGAGGNAGIWFAQTAHFAQRYRCITFDHRTFARSPCTDLDSINPAQFRDDLLAILDALSVDNAHLVGQSMGGFTILRTALDASARVRSLTMSCTPGGLPNPKPTAAVRGLFNSGAGSAGVLATMSKKSASDAVLMQLYHELNSFNTQFSWANLASLGAPEYQVTAADAGSVQCPVQFIAGAEDPLFPAELLQTYVPWFADASLRVISDAGHSPYFEQPQAFNEVLDSFLQRL